MDVGDFSSITQLFPYPSEFKTSPSRYCAKKRQSAIVKITENVQKTMTGGWSLLAVVV
jgi:hypothetical protein